MDEEMDERYDITDKEYNSILTLISKVVERSANVNEAAEFVRKFKAGESGIIYSVLNAVNALADKVENIEDFRKALNEVLENK